MYFEPSKFFPFHTQRLNFLCSSGFKLDVNRAPGESLLQWLEHLLPLLLPQIWCLQGCCSHTISLFSHSCLAASCTPSLVCFPEATLVAWLMWSTVSCSGTVQAGCVLHKGSASCFLTEATPTTSLLPTLDMCTLYSYFKFLHPSNFIPKLFLWLKQFRRGIIWTPSSSYSEIVRLLTLIKCSFWDTSGAKP